MGCVISKCLEKQNNKEFHAFRILLTKLVGQFITVFKMKFFVIGIIIIGIINIYFNLFIYINFLFGTFRSSPLSTIIHQQR